MKKAISDFIGHTPTVRLSAIEEHFGLKGCLLAKAEQLNPAGSIKDRVAKAITNNMERTGAIGSGSVIVEATSGNTGIALAMLGAIRGYRVKIVMPSSASVERAAIMSAYGAEVILTPGEEGMKGAIHEAEKICKSGAVMLGQFTDTEAIKCHYEGTASELWRDTCGGIDAFLCGVGTGATITGVGRFLKEKRRDIRVIAIEPSESRTLSGGVAGTHKIEGIGAGFVPPFFDYSLVDGIVSVTYDEAREAVGILARRCGIFAGISTGATLATAIKLARGELYGKRIAMIIADGGERYLSRS